MTSLERILDSIRRRMARRRTARVVGNWVAAGSSAALASLAFGAARDWGLSRSLAAGALVSGLAAGVVHAWLTRGRFGRLEAGLLADRRLGLPECATAFASLGDCDPENPIAAALRARIGPIDPAAIARPPHAPRLLAISVLFAGTCAALLVLDPPSGAETEDPWRIRLVEEAARLDALADRLDRSREIRQEAREIGRAIRAEDSPPSEIAESARALAERIARTRASARAREAALRALEADSATRPLARALREGGESPAAAGAGRELTRSGEGSGAEAGAATRSRAAGALTEAASRASRDDPQIAALLSGLAAALEASDSGAFETGLGRLHSAFAEIPEDDMTALELALGATARRLELGGSSGGLGRARDSGISHRTRGPGEPPIAPDASSTREPEEAGDPIPDRAGVPTHGVGRTGPPDHLAPAKDDPPRPAPARERLLAERAKASRDNLRLSSSEKAALTAYYSRDPDSDQ